MHEPVDHPDDGRQFGLRAEVAVRLKQVPGVPRAGERLLRFGVHLRPNAKLRGRFVELAANHLLGISAQVGTLAADKLADVFAIPGSPTVDISATERTIFVMKEGKILKHPGSASDLGTK